MESLRARLVRRTEVNPNTGCILWTGALDDDGYGRISIDDKRRSVRTHRAAWLALVGPIPKGQCVLHCCDVRHCVNVGHLFLGTKKDNTQDAKKKGRLAVGPRQGSARLTVKDVASIRSSSDGCMTLARRFGVSHSVISNVRHQKTYLQI